MRDKYFTDTNVGIAYTYYPDKFHPSVKDKINKTDKKLIWSSFTRYEFEKKYGEINKCIDNFLQEIHIILINEEIYSYDFFERTVLKNTKHIKIDNHKKIKTLELIWNNEKFNPFNPESLFSLIDELLLCFNQRKISYTSRMELFNCGENNYKNYPNILTKLREIDVHKPDYIIVIDANVLSSKEPITFLTCDEKLYSKITACNFLDIKNYELIEYKN